MPHSSEHSARKEEVLTAEFMTQLQGTSYIELVKALLLLNGGAAAALLAFVQAVWSGARPLVAPALSGIVIFGIGAAFAAAFHLVRSLALMFFQAGNERRWQTFRRGYLVCSGVSLTLFVVGACYVAIAISAQLRP